MSNPTTAMPQPCCDKCSSPRTQPEFLRNHVKVGIEVPEGDDCRVCWQEFGTRDQSTGRLDVPCQVVGLTGCSHIFGWACMTNLMNSTSICPLCRTTWFYTAMPRNGSYLTGHPEQYKVYKAQNFAQLLSIDYITARGLMFREARIQLQSSRLRTAVAKRQLSICNRIHFALEKPDVQDYMAEVQDSHPYEFDERLYDHYACLSKPYAYGNPFTLKNWHLNTNQFAIAIYLALETVNGERLRETFEKQSAIAIQAYLNTAALGHTPLEVRAVTRILVETADRVAKEFAEWYGDESVCHFAKLVLLVYEQAGLSTDNHFARTSENGM